MAFQQLRSPDFPFAQQVIQLAKAALYAGVKLLMDKQGIDHVDRRRDSHDGGDCLVRQFTIH